MMLSLILSLSLVLCEVSASVPTPLDVLGRAIPYYLSQMNDSALLKVNQYGPAIALAATFDASVLFGERDWAVIASNLIDAYAADTSSLAYAVLHNITVDPGYSVGDELGLMPLSYVARALAEGVAYNSNNSDWMLALRVVNEYVIPWKRTLSDGTITRDVGSWSPKEPDVNASFLWSDDQFMGTALLCRLAGTAGFPPVAAAHLAEWALAQQLGFASRQQRAASGLFSHGYNAATGDNSCCAWGRANGWVMMAHAAVVSLAAKVVPHSVRLPLVVSVWQRQAQALLALQDTASGLWHQVLDDPTTFLETSASAMFIQSMADGSRGGWLNRSAVTGAVTAGWAGVASTVTLNGSITGICEGTGIGVNEAFYQARKTDYADAAPGIGAVFRAALAVATPF